MKNLRKYRKAAKLTGEQVAREIGVSSQTYWNWEQGRNEPGASKVKPLADLFGVSVEELLKEE